MLAWWCVPSRLLRRVLRPPVALWLLPGHVLECHVVRGPLSPGQVTPEQITEAVAKQVRAAEKQLLEDRWDCTWRERVFWG